MELKRLEVYGFKSFANRMVFDFSPGMTVIVGPNGSGKSNVVDSIQWIFGEMSPKTLRGTGMADVIFSGSRNRRAYGYAEGTLTFSNEDRSMSVDTDEVSITRTIYRSGESEYFINGERCRLTDIKMLLQGTGLGSTEYSIIQQGSVEKLVGKDSKSRRSVFDEAAGVSTYKYRRDRANRKLEKVDINLDRLNDKIESVQRELRSLKRRARAAERYQRITNEWREKDILLCNLRYGEVISALSEKQEKLETLQREIEEAGVLEGSLSADVTKLEESFLSSSRKVDAAERNKIEIENSISRSENTISLLAGHIEEKQAFAEERELENREIDERQEKSRREIDELTASIEQIDGEVTEKEDRCSATAKDLNEIRNEFSRIMEIIEGKKKSLEETYSSSSVTKNEIDTLHAEKKALASNRKEMEAKHEKELVEQDRLREQITNIESDISGIEEKRSGLSAELDGLIEKKESLAENRDAVRSKISDITHDMTRIDSRLHLLLDLENKYEGIMSGVKGVLEALKKDENALKGVYGMVADFIGVDISNEDVIEIALGDNVQNIIVDTADNAYRAVRYLQENNLGKAVFMPEEAYRNGFGISEELLGVEGVEGKAIDLIEYRKEHEGIVKQLLGTTVVVDSIDTAKNIDSRLLEDVTVVTRDGYLIERNGMISGGSLQKMGGIISRKNEIEKLAQEQDGNRERSTVLQARMDDLKTDSGTVLEGIREAERTIDELSSSVSDKRNLLVKAERDYAHVHEFANNLGATIVSTGVRLQEIEELLVEKEGKFNWFEKLSDLLGKEIGALEEKAGKLAGKRDALQQEISDLRISLATTNGNKEIISEKISNLKNVLTECELKTKKNIQLADKSRREIERNRETIKEQEQQIAENRDQLKQTERDLVEKKNGAEHIRSEYDRVKSKYRDILAQSKKQNEQIRKYELDINNYNHEKTAIEQRMRENHDRDICATHADFVKPEEEIDRAQLEQDVKALFTARSKIRGADPGAVEQMESVRIRAEFLEIQRNDLQKARDALSSLIRKINRESSKRFLDTFETIRENFKLMFRKMFGGGRADLVLEPDEDVLDAGIDIVCRPPGSKLQSITLLSGGQKAMVIISLLFSVLQTNPAPVCILDEIDGPLDEANVDRFLAMVREFMKDSQFLVISHNKKTVSKAGLIYGITMQEPGVSKKLSLEFEDIRKDESLLGEQTEEGVLAG